MAEAVSRGGFHVQHLRHGDGGRGSGTRGDRGRLMHEAMRDLDDADAARQAARNSSIVAADTAKNYALVNDGAGAFRKAQSVDEVLDYGDARMASVYRKMSATSFETSTIVAWAPKSILREVPNFYPVYDEDGNEVGRRSRWVIDDPEAFARWRDETVGYLSDEVLPGGHDAVHAVVVNLDESVPHIHLVCDPFAPDPKHPGKLRTEAQQAWGSHRDVTEERADADGKVRTVQITGATKMRRYQEGYREHLLSRGFAIERDVNPEGTSLKKGAFRTLESRKVAVDAQAANVANTAVMVEEARDLDRDAAASVKRRLDAQRKKLDADRAAWQDTERPALVAAAKNEGREAGAAAWEREKPAVVAAARAQGHAEGLASGRAEVVELRNTAAADAAAAARDRLAAKQVRERAEEEAQEYFRTERAKIDETLDRRFEMNREKLNEAYEVIKDRMRYSRTAAEEASPAALLDVLRKPGPNGEPSVLDQAHERAERSYNREYGAMSTVKHPLDRAAFLKETVKERDARRERGREIQRKATQELAEASRRSAAARGQDQGLSR